jgi:hypothetical protein
MMIPLRPMQRIRPSARMRIEHRDVHPTDLAGDERLRARRRALVKRARLDFIVCWETG